MNYRALTIGEALERLLVPAPTVVIFHARPDGDAIGSAFALAAFLESTGSPAYCLCADEIPDRLKFLVDGVQESVLAQSLPVELENRRL